MKSIGGWPAFAAMVVMLLPVGVQAQQLRIPEPTGYVNDFANVIDADAEATLRRVIDEVRAKSGGEIVVVTLPSLERRGRLRRPPLPLR